MQRFVCDITKLSFNLQVSFYRHGCPISCTIHSFTRKEVKKIWQKLTHFQAVSSAYAHFNRYSCIEFLAQSCLKPFKSWDSCAVWTWLLTWQNLIWALNCLHDITQESVAALTDHFIDAFVQENVAPDYDVVET